MVLIIAKVIGSVWATRKDERLSGFKLLLIQPLHIRTGSEEKEPLVAVDTIGAGIGEIVICLFGHAASSAAGNAKLPIDAAIAGIVDGYEMEELEC